MVGEDLFPFCRLPFCLTDSVLCLQKLFSFRRSHLLIVNLSVCATGVIFRKWSPVPMCSKLLLTFSSISFSVTGFMLMSLIHLDLSFMQDDHYGSICILHTTLQLCQPHLLKMPSFSIVYFWLFIFVTNQVLIGVWIYVRVI